MSATKIVAKNGNKVRFEPCVQRILGEVGGDINAAVTRLKALHWEEGEARSEIAACLRQGVRRAAKRSGAHDGR